jgi:hypothetical protein
MAGKKPSKKTSVKVKDLSTKKDPKGGRPMLK